MLEREVPATVNLETGRLRCVVKDTVTEQDITIEKTLAAGEWKKLRVAFGLDLPNDKT